MTSSPSAAQRVSTTTSLLHERDPERADGADSFAELTFLLLLIGLWTRPVAFILPDEMAVAYFQFHAPKGFWPVVNGGIPAVLFCFIWLYCSAAGAGPWSLDARRGKSLRA